MKIFYNLILMGLLLIAPVKNWAQWEERAKILHETPSNLDLAGASIAIDGDTVVIGALQDDNSGSQSGAAFIYYKDQGGTDNYGLVTELTTTELDNDDLFGSAVDADGDYIIIGARADEFSSAFMVTTGAAYVFERNSGGADNWGEINRLANTFGATDLFGSAVSIDGDFIAVGARGTSSGTGRVFIYDNYGANYIGQIDIPAADVVAGAAFGASVEVNGTQVLVGAPGPISGNNGRVYIFNETNAYAAPIQVINSPNPASINGDAFGSSLAADAEFMIVGAPNLEHGGSPWAGRAYIYDNTSGSYVMVKTAEDLTIDVRDYYGRSVDIENDRAVIGFPSNTVGGLVGGAVVLYKDEGGINNWGEEGILEPTADPPTNAIPDYQASSQYGNAVSITVNKVAVGAPLKDEGATTDGGASYVFVNPALLPSSIIDFTAIKENKNALLNWVISNLTAGDVMQIQHSRDGVYWESIHSQTAAFTNNGVQRFSSQHIKPASGIHYYKLAVASLTGEEKSAIKSLVFNGQLLVYPNPATEYIQVSFEDTRRQVVQITLFDVNGRLAFKQEYIPTGNSLTIPVRHLANGAYVLSIMAGNKQLAKEKIIIQH